MNILIIWGEVDKTDTLPVKKYIIQSYCQNQSNKINLKQPL